MVVDEANESSGCYLESMLHAFAVTENLYGHPNAVTDLVTIRTKVRSRFGDKSEGREMVMPVGGYVNASARAPLQLYYY